MTPFVDAARRTVRWWATWLGFRTPARRDGYQYDAFVSYASADAATVRWLHGELSRFWVPGFGRRNVFLDEANLVPGPLEDGLRVALARSAVLVICWSDETRHSSYVAMEIEAFLETHSPDRVVVCLVGAVREDLPELPARLAALAAPTSPAVLMPDLRGYASDRRPGRSFRLAALSVLAAVLRLPDKGVLLDRRKKAIRLVGAAAAVCLSTAASWFAWTRTDRYQTNAIVAELRRGDVIWQEDLAPILEPLLVCLDARGYRSIEEDVPASNVQPLGSKLAGALVRDLARRGEAGAADNVLDEAARRARAIDARDVRAEALVALVTRAEGAVAGPMVAKLATEAVEVSRGDGNALADADRLGRMLSAVPDGVASAEAGRLADALANEGDAALLRRAVSAVAPMLRGHASRAQLDRLADEVSSGMSDGDPVFRWGAETEAAVTLARLGYIDPAHEALRRATADARRVRNLPVAYALRGIVEFALAVPGGVPDQLVPDLKEVVEAIDGSSYRATAAADLAGLIASRDPAGAAALARTALSEAKDIVNEDRVSVLATIASTLAAADLRSWVEAAAEAIYEALSSDTGQVTQPGLVADAAIFLETVAPDRAAAVLSAAEEAARFGDVQTMASVRSASASLAAGRGGLRAARLLAASIPVAKDKLRAYAAVACVGRGSANRLPVARP